jgi:hypothetical protein
MELLECSAGLHERVDALGKGLRKARDDSMSLWHASSDLIGEVEHFRYHLRGAVAQLRRIQTAARELPPLQELNDDELSDMVLDDAYRALRGQASCFRDKSIVRSWKERMRAGKQERRQSQERGGAGVQRRGRRQQERVKKRRRPT